VRPLLLVAVLAGVAHADDPFAGDARPARERDTAAFAVVNNPPAIVNEATKSFIQPLLDSYEESAVLDDGAPAGGGERLRQFAARLRRALERRRAVDLFVLAHTNVYYGLVAAIPVELRRKIRLVYDSGCFGATLAARAWRRHGAQAVVAHRGESCSPLFVNRFRTYWWGGLPAGAAVARANRDLERVYLEGRRRDLLEDFYWCGTDRPRATLDETRGQLFGDASVHRR
jgi:hypothetical protein